jgi:type IV fimbrial biogenesis protein FimT
MRLKHRGFTLIEATISLAVAGIVMGIAVPSVTSATEAAHSGAAKAKLLATLNRAIGHAAATGVEVVLCPGDIAGGCRPSPDWSGGWIAFADLDGNRQHAATETLLVDEAALGGKTHLRSTEGRTRLVFQPNGGNAGSNVTFTLCDGRGADQATTLVLANNGRLRAGTPTAEAAQACMQAM